MTDPIDIALLALNAHRAKLYAERNAITAKIDALFDAINIVENCKPPAQRIVAKPGFDVTGNPLREDS